jgi:protoporphyrinogen/coproporphyrinogen III oxidase
MARIVVVGGGIAGLATAFELRRAAAGFPGGLDVRVLEASDRTGGNLRTEKDDGYSVEWGPNGFLDSVPETLDLVERAGLTAELQRADPAAARRFLVRGGRLRELPSGPGSFLFSRVLSLGGRLRVLAEPFASRPPDGDETVFEFARRRIGREAAAVLVDAMVSGVFAGDSRRLSLASCFPKMAAMEAEHGGLVRAMIARQRERKAARRHLEALRAEGREAPELSRPGGPAGPAGTLTSFRDGIERFARGLEAALGDAVEVGRPVLSLTRDPETARWRIEAEGGEALEADAVVLATPAPHAAPLLRPLDETLSKEIAAIPTAPLAVVALAWDAAAIGGAPNGFGFLAPRGEGCRILGCLWDSSIFPGRAPAGKVLLRAMVGGAQDPAAIALTDEELLATARADLARAMGISVPPERHWIFRHRLGISQYTVGHGARLGRIADRLERLPGLELAGQSYFGVSMNSAAERAASRAPELVARLARRTAAEPASARA